MPLTIEQLTGIGQHVGRWCLDGARAEDRKGEGPHIALALIDQAGIETRIMALRDARERANCGTCEHGESCSVKARIMLLYEKAGEVLELGAIPLVVVDMEDGSGAVLILSEKARAQA